jgi:signal transduction histidine kinase/FixJ family two-component response regulator
MTVPVCATNAANAANATVEKIEAEEAEAKAEEVEAVPQQRCEMLMHRLILVDRTGDWSGMVILLHLRQYVLAAAATAGGDRAMGIQQLQPSVMLPLPPPLPGELSNSESPALDPATLPGTADQVLGQIPRGDQHLAHGTLLAQNVDLIQVNQMKDEFLACITHELRSPLTAILGLSTLLKDQALGDLNDRQLRYAQQIHRSGRHLIGIVNDMLDLTQIETDQFELDFEPVSIAGVCLDAFEASQKLYLAENLPQRTSFPSQASVGNHSTAVPAAPPAPAMPAAPDTLLPTFTLEIEPGLVMLTADENRLRQMLINLLSNALKFTDTSGNIGLKVGYWEGWIAFTVWDTGIGIAPDKQHLIFQKFQQLESPMTRRFEGTGLGLVLTQRLARLHGGDITFTSQEHQGSQFTLLLPPEPPQAVLQTTAVPKSPVTADRVGDAYVSDDCIGQSCRLPISARLVLVVEASTRNLEDLTDQLSELGYRSAIARSGIDALEKARQLQPCVILLNPHLPNLSGWDVLTLLKARTETQKIPVIITATATEQAQAYEQLADGFLKLPIVHGSLRDTLQHLTQHLPQPMGAEHPSKRDRCIVLCLNPPTAEGSGAWSIELSHLLHRHNFRVIESYDLEQAELLARVWKVQVVVLNAPALEPMQFLTQLSEQVYLSSLPVVTLDAVTTQIANQIPNLAVFPCLANWVYQSPIGNSEMLAEQLLQAIEIAVGFAGRPFILATDLATWTAQAPPDRQDWLQALIQYMQAAGLRGTIGRSRQDIQQTLESQSVSLMLLYWHDNTNVLQRALTALAQLDPMPPMLLIDHHHSTKSIGPALNKSLQALNIPVVSPTASMDDLLRHIRHVLGMAG